MLYDCWETGRTGKAALGMTRDAILHLRNLSSDGIVGMDWRRIHSKTTLNKPAAVTDFIGTFFRNYCKPLVAIIYPENVQLSKEQKAAAREAFMQASSGENYGTPAVVDRGVKIETHALDLSTSQVQEILDKSPAEICAVPRSTPQDRRSLPQHEQQHCGTGRCVQHRVPRSHAGRIEGELSMLVDGELVDGAPLRVVMDPWELTRGANKDRAEAEEIWIRTGMMSVNQARGMEGWMPLADSIAGETTYDANRVPASLLHEVTKARAIKDGARIRQVRPRHHRRAGPKGRLERWSTRIWFGEWCVALLRWLLPSLPRPCGWSGTSSHRLARRTVFWLRRRLCTPGQRSGGRKRRGRTQRVGASGGQR